MKIEKNKVVVLSYELEVEGKVVDAATQDNPLDYIQGMHMLIPRFEDELEGLEDGAAFSFTIQPEEGYGSYDEKRRILLPKSAFTIQGEVREDLMEIGRILPMVGADGSIVNATVVEVKEEGVTMDFNHPMAGKVLNFKGKVLSVRDATEKELTEGLHGEFLPLEEGHHCCHGKGKGHCHHHHEHEDGECCGHHDHGDGECCGHHDHGDGECCGHGHCHHEEE
ncbi:MAG: FKBP-type peptidyl-prolyl cis-trans isomerase [Bacteroidales bacterium]|nr:FKBP-type peptidyl-prolyl cis-trans isomerase [Bacteroidales bacterium]